MLSVLVEDQVAHRAARRDARGNVRDHGAGSRHPADGRVVGRATAGDRDGLGPTAVPVMTTSVPENPVTAELKTTVKLIGDVAVGSACVVAWLIVTVGAPGAHVTVLSEPVDAVFRLPAASLATLASSVTMTVPAVVRPVTPTLYDVGPPVTVTISVPPAVPATSTSALVKLPTGFVNTTVKLIGCVDVGSLWPTAWLTVTPRAVWSHRQRR